MIEGPANRLWFLGPVAWVLLLLGTSLGASGVTFIQLLLSFAFLVVVPLAIGSFQWSNARADRIRKAALAATAATGVMASVSLFLSPALISGVLALTWMMCTGLVALSALTQFLSERTLNTAIILRGAGCTYLLVGGGWFVISRLGARPLELSHTIVELTAVHFHFAGFVAPLIATSAMEWCRRDSSWASKTCGLAGLGVVAAMPVVATGIATSPGLEVAGSALLGTSLVILGVSSLFVTSRSEVPTKAKLLVAFSGASVIVSMAVAIQYALGQFLGTRALGMAEMARIHGSLNAFGFSLCGLLGWRALHQEVS